MLPKSVRRRRHLHRRLWRSSTILLPTTTARARSGKPRQLRPTSLPFTPTSCAGKKRNATLAERSSDGIITIHQVHTFLINLSVRLDEATSFQNENETHASFNLSFDPIEVTLQVTFT